MTKQLRQGESVDLTASDASTFKFSGYIDGTDRRSSGASRGRAPPTRSNSRATAAPHFALGLAGPVPDSERHGLLGRPIHLRATRGRGRPGDDRPDLRHEHLDRRPRCRTSNFGTWRAEEPMRNALLRAMHREEGYSLVISMLLMAIMMVLLAVSLDAGSSSLHQSSLSFEWSKALTVAEGGADAAVTLLGESRSATNSARSARTTSVTVSTASTRSGGRPAGARSSSLRSGTTQRRPTAVRARGPDHVRARPVVQVRDLLADRACRREQHDA